MDRALKCQPVAVFAGLAVIVLVAYAAPLFGNATFIGRDHLTHTIPGKQVIADALQAGHLPEWWSGADLGVPFAANPNHSALYPPVWLVAVLPMPWAADFVLILHVLLAGLGTAALSRRVGANLLGATVAGAAFMLTGFTTSTVVHGGPLLTLAWTPWILWAGDRLALSSTKQARIRATLGLATFVGLQLVTGDPSIAILTAWLLLAIVLSRGPRRVPALLATAAALVAGVLLASVAILPALLLARESSRGAGIDPALATVWSMHPMRALEWIWPNVLGDGNQPSEHLARIVADASGATDLAPGWALSLYVSLPVIVLAVFGWLRGERKLRWLALAAGGFVMIALGRYTPVYALYRTVFLPERLVRYPEKYVGGAILLACVMAGLGWTSIAVSGVARRGRVAVGAVVAVFATCVFAVVLAGDRVAGAFSDEASQLTPPLDARSAVHHATRNGLTALAVVVALAALLYLARRESLRRWLVPATAVVLVGHLVTLSWQVLPMFDRSIVERPPRILEQARDGEPHRLYRSLRSFVTGNETVPERILSFYDSAAPNTATRFGFDYIRGYDQGHSAHFERTWTRWLVPSGRRALDLFGVDLAIVGDTSADEYRLVHNKGARPRAFVASRWHWYVNEDALLAALFPPGARVADHSVLETVHLLGTGTDQDDAGPLVPCQTEAPRPELVHVTCDSVGGYAVLLDTWADGWTASVDGVPARIERADALVRAVQVPAGRHVIEMRYRTPGLRAGAIISALAWLALLVAWLFALRATSESNPNSP